MKIKYHDVEFAFERSAERNFNGRLLLSPEDRALLSELLDAEVDGWYLDQHGERLPAESLFEKSPWSAQTPDGKIKILNRFLNVETGEARFSVPETYGGELFAWVRGK